MKGTGQSQPFPATKRPGLNVSRASYRWPSDDAGKSRQMMLKRHCQAVHSRSQLLGLTADVDSLQDDW